MTTSIFADLAKATSAFLATCAQQLEKIAANPAMSEQEKVDGIAEALRLRPAQAKNVLAGVAASTQMPEFHEKVTARGNLHYDTYAVLGKKLSGVAPEELRQAEGRLIEAYSITDTPSAAKISNACVPREAPKEPTAKKVSYDPTNPESARDFISRIPNMLTPTADGGAVLATVIKPEHSRAVTEVLTKAASQPRYSHDPSSILTGALLGERIPRITLHALKIPDGQVYLEGQGWVDGQTISEHPPFLVNKNQLSPRQIAELIVANPNLHRVKLNFKE